MKKTLILFALLLFLSAATVFPQKLSTIAVVDFQEIIDSFPSGSPAFSRLQNLKNAYEERRLDYLEQLNTKELALLEAKQKDDELEIAQLEREIVDFKAFLRQWQEIKIKEIEIVQSDLLRGRDIALDMLRAIEYVAINEGYTIVLDANAISVIWLSPEIDITALVINRLRAMAR